MPLTKPHCGPHEPAQPTLDFYNEQAVGTSSGLTKREYFAALAMQGLSAAPWCETIGSKVVATIAVEAADALIAALNEGAS